MANDPYWNSVVLAMHMDDTGLTDLKGHAVTVLDGAVRSALQAAPLTGNSYSLKLNGSSTGFLTIPYSTDFNIGTGDVNIRAWIYIQTDSTANTGDSLRQANICSFGFPSTVNSWSFSVNGSTSATGTGLVFSAWVSSTQYICASSTAISKLAWHLVEFKRISGVCSLAVDGVNQTLTTNTLTTQNITGTAGNLFRIGNLGVTGYEGRMNGYVDDFLFTKAARPTELPTVPFGNKMVQIAGIVEDVNGALTNKPVHVHRQSDGALAGIATSNATTGMFSVAALDTSAHYATCIYSNTEPAITHHNIIPV